MQIKEGEKENEAQSKGGSQEWIIEMQTLTQTG